MDPTGCLFYDDVPFSAPHADSIFLIGPTAAHAHRTPWRAEAVSGLRHRGFAGVIVIPEFRAGGFRRDFFEDRKPAQIPGMSRTSQRILEWETAGIDHAHVLLAWMPFTLLADEHDPASLPGFTTRPEVARATAMRHPRLVLGMPAGALSGGHLRYHAYRAQIPIYDTLAECLRVAVQNFP